MIEATTVPNMWGTLGVALGWIVFIAGGITIGILFSETIWALTIGLALLIGIPVWAGWSTWTDRKRQSRQNRN